jgi:hypothetical protein
VSERVCIYLAAFPSTNIDETILDVPDAKGKSGVEDKVDDNSQSGEAFRGFKAVLVIQSKGHGGDDDGRVSKGELQISVPVGLAELERVEVVLKGIVGRVFAVCESEFQGGRRKETNKSCY